MIKFWVEIMCVHVMWNDQFVFLHNLRHLCCKSNLSLRAGWYTLKQIYAEKIEIESSNMAA